MAPIAQLIEQRLVNERSGFESRTSNPIGLFFLLTIETAECHRRTYTTLIADHQIKLLCMYFLCSVLLSFRVLNH